MAMLAEPRQKKKFCLDPRGSAWTNDDSKFGQKLLEKMGWSKGKGLGASEDGIKEPVKATVRTDKRGVGCSKSYADNWIAHQDDFNDLLANLSQDHGGGDNSKEEDTARVSSLEQKSRISRSRVHYQKFTSGKDLSLKSSNDLDCVFGKRKSRSESNTPLNQSEASSDASDTEENAHGLRYVNSLDSVQSYFAKRMAEKKAKWSSDFDKTSNHDSLEMGKTDNVLVNDDDGEQLTAIQNQTEERKSKKKSKNYKKAEDQKTDNDEIIWFGSHEKDGDRHVIDTGLNENVNQMNEGLSNVENTEVDIIEKKRKKKSRKKKKNEVDEKSDFIDTDTGNMQELDMPAKDEPAKKKRKKSKKCTSNL